MASGTRTTGRQDSRRMRVLAVHASGRINGSVSRRLTDDLIDAIEAREGSLDVTHRDLADGVGHVDEAWITANFTPDEERSAEQRDRLAESDALVAELEAADVVIIGTPIYNFGVPAALKAWIDMIARARKTFRYTENGPVGLLEGKKAYVVIASGGVALDSAQDFATPYLRHALAFVGIEEIEIIGADQLNRRGDDAIDSARLRIAERVHTAPAAGSRAA